MAFRLELGAGQGKVDLSQPKASIPSRSPLLFSKHTVPYIHCTIPATRRGHCFTTILYIISLTLFSYLLHNHVCFIVARATQGFRPLPNSLPDNTRHHGSVSLVFANIIIHHTSSPSLLSAAFPFPCPPFSRLFHPIARLDTYNELDENRALLVRRGSPFPHTIHHPAHSTSS